MKSTKENPAKKKSNSILDIIVFIIVAISILFSIGFPLIKAFAYLKFIIG